jgi:vacuolar-type H+-ATPase subunit H
MGKLKTGAAIGLGAGLAAAAVAAALGSYLLTGRRATKTKRVLKGWMLKAKGELLEQMENAGEVGQDMFNDAVDRIVKKYSKMAGVGEKELNEMAAELKKQWKVVEKGLKHVKKIVK